MSEENTVENNSARESLRRMAIGRAEKLLEI